ncbi:MAG: hypothetical protein KDC56_12515, partial [Flavobacteriaceae bacterium]|nr:hypothetical protein [Flavobacteriaceae bacterium]
NKIDTSNLMFEKLAGFKKAPLRYRIHAEIDRAKNFSEKDSAELFITHFDKLLRDSENRPFFDEIYYQKGRIEAKNDSIDLAIADYKRSLTAKEAEDFQKELTYEQLGTIYFDKADFQTAGAYYDSVINLTKNKNDKRIRRIARKRNSLDEVIRFENIAKTNDSILTIAALSPEEQQTYFQNYIDQLKKEEEEAKRRAEQAVTSGFGDSLNDDGSKSASGGKFYFYNIQVSGFGKQEFKKVWGNRPLEDNWRLSTKSIVANNDLINQPVTTDNTLDNAKKFDLDYYISRIPSAPAELDSINSLRNDAYYKLGIIYEEQFKEYKLAAERLEKLLTFKPAEALVVPTYYHLYKIYSIFDPDKGNNYKNSIVKNYQDSRYATIIMNPEKLSVSEEIDNTPEAVYNDAFCDYDYYHYDTALEKIDKAVKQFEGEPIIPKFELLKAFVLLKTQGRQAFRDALNFVALNYPNTEEGKYAVTLLNTVTEMPDQE